MTDERARSAQPIAARLITAVALHDPDQVASILDTVTDWPALAVVLADQATLPDLPRGGPFLLSEDDRRRAHAAHQRGEEGAWIRLGEREYQRARARRRRRTPTSDDASPDTLDGGTWVAHGGIQRFIAHDQDTDTGAA